MVARRLELRNLAKHTVGALERAVVIDLDVEKAHGKNIPRDGGGCPSAVAAAQRDDDRRTTGRDCTIPRRRCGRRCARVKRKTESRRGHGVGLRDRPRVPGAAGLDERVRPREIWPLETIIDEISEDDRRQLYVGLQEQVKERGLWAAHLPPDLGGQGFGQVELGLMHEILGTCAYAPNVFGCQAPDSGNSEILAMFGTPEQKGRWMEPLLPGEIRSAFSMTEPENAGSDPTTLQTRAAREGDEYVINGHKWYTSNGSIADFLIVMTVTDPEARPHQRATMLIVPIDRQA